tara:strand:- start:305 stop:1081 length:777 start_codon:yes stop_codon:yes gene_type:complete
MKAVAALGELNPLGEIRRLAAPSGIMSSTPRVAKLLVEEGDQIVEGQILAIFDNRDRLLADKEKLDSQIKMLQKNIEIIRSEKIRYQKAFLEGAVSQSLFDQKQYDFIQLNGLLNQANAERKGVEFDLENSYLKSPINGLLLKVITREGERPGPDGVVEVGASQFMEALIEVYESDVNRVSIGQKVFLTSENGGFNGTLSGLVDRISPQVRQRKVLATDPTGDADARVVEVRVKLDVDSAILVRRLTGMKVIARFEPE